MNISNRSAVLLAILMLFVFLLPAITGPVSFIEDNEFPDADDFETLSNSFIAFLARITVQQMLSGLMLGISIFALCVVYRGGRSNHGRFNDRTIAGTNLFRGIFSLTALNRAVFVFLYFAFEPVPTKKQLYRNPIPNNDSHYKEVPNHAFNY